MRDMPNLGVSLSQNLPDKPRNETQIMLDSAKINTNTWREIITETAESWQK
jgi:hypothetical protein